MTWLLLMSLATLGEETPYGRGMTEANVELRILDDMEDVADWDNGSPDETRLSSSRAHPEHGAALLFANIVDHTRGEKKYPVGWPRAGKNLVKSGQSDWSQWDELRFYVFVEAGREELERVPIGLGLSRTGVKVGSSFPFRDLKKNSWNPIVIPIDRVADPGHVDRMQFHISESDYRHGDRVNFYIAGLALARFVQPAIARFQPTRQILFATDRHATAAYKLVGRQGIERVALELSLGRGDRAVATVKGPPSPAGDISIVLPAGLTTGPHWLRLGIRDGEGRLLDRRQAEIEILAGPFAP